MKYSLATGRTHILLPRQGLRGLGITRHRLSVSFGPLVMVIQSRFSKYKKSEAHY